MQTQPSASSPSGDGRLAQARALLQHLEAGDDTAAAQALDDLARLRETEIFREIGKLTRDLHDALNAFRLDSRFGTIASVEIPDAKDRLKHVIRMTDQAATQTLTAIEGSKPLCEQIQSRASELGDGWRRFMRRDMQVEEFRELSRKVADFLPWAAASATEIDGNLSEVLMAQSFQDLTGQIIKRVIALVEDVEQNLVNLIRISGGKLAPAPEGTKGERARLEGPQIPGMESPDAVCGQDEVDSLLSSLGF